MANFLRYSMQALEAIPQERRVIVHQMYEDNDLDGAKRAETLFDCLELASPGQLVGILANDSVSPPCCHQAGHFNCDYYDPYWYTVFVSAAAWKEYKAAVEAKEQAHKAAHGCREQ